MSDRAPVRLSVEAVAATEEDLIFNLHEQAKSLFKGLPFWLDGVVRVDREEVSTMRGPVQYHWRGYADYVNWDPEQETH